MYLHTKPWPHISYKKTLDYQVILQLFHQILLLEKNSKLHLTGKHFILFPGIGMNKPGTLYIPIFLLIRQ